MKNLEQETKKHTIVLFQSYLRKPILNFGKYLKNFQFIVKNPSSGIFYHSQLPPFEHEINRKKTSRINRIRRFLGIPNVRVKFDSQADLFFTYGCMLVTNKPYCIYIENGLTIYNYDTRVAKKLIARLIVSILVKQKNCKKLIFMNQAAEKSFLAATSYDRKTIQAIKNKSIIIYPIFKSNNVRYKKFDGHIRLLFVGLFYMKGGKELVNTFEKICLQYKNVSLTIITPIHTINTLDIERLNKMPKLTLLDADFNEQQMSDFYKNNDIFVLPTFRDSFPAVLIEAISWGMPIICNNQYATTEVALDGHNAFVYWNHPLKDYNPVTLKLLGNFYNPKDFYTQLFKYQETGKTKPIENFIYKSIEKFILNPGLLEKFSQSSLKIYNEKFNPDMLSEKIEKVFLEALNK